ncbi:MAG: hypothetical protein C0168_01240 [Candidatus Aminicenantes bacterium]|nr:MAG: hypothetical protein C0168_01240 [Candidatus Aminicenantes bacterium]
MNLFSYIEENCTRLYFSPLAISFSFYLIFHFIKFTLIINLNLSLFHRGLPMAEKKRFPGTLAIFSHLIIF